MAKKVTRSAAKLQAWSQWNFILFLVLAFILMVSLLNALKNISLDIRSKAGLVCPQVVIPRAEDCPGGWKYQRDVTNGCPTFVCEVK